MFVRLAPRAAGQDPDLVAELAELAGFLPLAVSLLARVYARHPAWGLADLITEARQRTGGGISSACWLRPASRCRPRCAPSSGPDRTRSCPKASC